MLEQYTLVKHDIAFCYIRMLSNCLMFTYETQTLSMILDEYLYAMFIHPLELLS